MKKDIPIEHIRHSLAHLLAAAVLELWPDAKRTIGPAIADGFYYDFEFSSPIGDNDLPKIEKQMRKILPTWKEFSQREVSAEEARKIFSGNQYKLELIDDIEKLGEKITIYISGTYEDLCRGGHVENAHAIKADAFTLSRTAGAYWRGNEKNTMLTRIYGLAFASKEELQKHLTMLEEARKRDHKKLGKELDLFTFSDLVGPGLPLWTPKGTLLRHTLDEFVWSLRKSRGYQRVEIPHITKKDLYEKSGHWSKFKDELFRITTREDHLFAMKPMNCPHHIQIYDRKTQSYRELPQRYANTTMCYRDEQSGELSGLSRVRAFTQDDAHVFCRYNQVKEEVFKVWDIITEFYSACGFTLSPRLSLHDPKHPEKYMGGSLVWDRAENDLRAIVKERGEVTIEAPGEAAFYGPKIDFMSHDSIGRQWQLATIQLDMSQPESFDLTCINEKGEKERIVMIHAAIMGSIERFLSVYIEHCAGAFPLWLAPVQVKVLPIGDAQLNYAKGIHATLSQQGIRTELDDANETLGKKIRTAKLEKVPYFLVLGNQELASRTITLESRDRGNQGTLSLDALTDRLGEEIQLKK
ncbi:MAG: threonyl-tRNA synthetase [Parcubacteria group bacterium Gr01-1014_48]|nr:MAG: threonyl-tRNA synthetase [Parcubacteria group bacterium Greene0416_14]TSC73250.1 MAG: threonyl-tRNA synthetase [Parcubacteria group bacterium Gr01-1014_48]